MCITELRSIPAGGPLAYAAPGEVVGVIPPSSVYRLMTRLGGVKAPKQVEAWPDLPRSKVGKVLKADIKSRLRARPGAP